MKCRMHPMNNAIAVCPLCGRAICEIMMGSISMMVVFFWARLPIVYPFYPSVPSAYAYKDISK